MEGQQSKSAQARDSSLDFVRGIAILMVMRWHTLIPPPVDMPTRLVDWPAARFGWAGVDVFFVLSGFLVGGLLIREGMQTSKIDSRRFLLRRLFKIWPGYLIYVVVSSLINGRPFGELLPNFVHLQNYLGTPLKQTWSLAVEEHFYLLLAFALAYLGRRGRLRFDTIVKFCTAIFAMSFVSRTVGWIAGQTPVQIQWETQNRVDTLMLGLLLAAVYRYRPELFRRICAQKLLLALGVGLVVVFLSLVDRDSVWMATVGYPIAGLGAGCGLLLLFSAVPGNGLLGRLRTTLFFRAVALIGFYSYGIYLWHRVGAQASVVVAARLPALNETLRWYVLTGTYLVVAIGVGVLATKLIELPFLGIRDRRVPSTIRALAYGAKDS